MTNTQQSNTTSAQQGISEWTYFYAALMFYTRLPAPKDTPHSQEILDGSRKYFPLIGIIIGAISVTVFLFFQLFFPNTVSVALAMVAGFLATGAFHEDGFADSCDGLGGGWEKEQVLRIMKDSRVGTYAVVGLLSLLAIKFLALLELSNTSLSALVFCVIGAHTTSRLFASMVIESYDYVRDIKQSKAKPATNARLSSQDTHTTFIIGAMPVLILLFVAFIPTLFALVAAFACASAFARYSKKRIDGYTGDILGAIQQLSELTFYLAFLALL